MHFRNPDDLNQGSIIPPYPWLMSKKLDFESIPLRIKAMQTLGVPYPQYEGNARDQSKADAEAQAAKIAADFVEQNKGPYVDLNGQEHDLADKRVVALVAFLQRVGTDLFKSPDEPTEEASNEEAPVAEPTGGEEEATPAPDTAAQTESAQSGEGEST